MTRSRPIRIVCAVLAAVIVIGLVTGIAFWTANNDSSVKEPGLYVSGKRVADPGVMLTVGEHEVSFEEYRHYFLTMRDALESYYGTVNWEYDPDGELALLMTDRVEEELATMYAWIEIAKDEGITLGEDDLADIEAEIAEQKEAYGEGFGEYLADRYFADEAAWRRNLEELRLYEKAMEAYTEKMKEEHADEAEGTDGLITAKHILVGFDEYETKEEAKEAADKYYKEIVDSEDPEATFDEYRELYDYDTAQPDTGYTFAEGEMVESFYEGALALKPGEMSEPIESDYGYHIIWRTELNADDAASVVEGQVDALADEYADKAVQEKIASMEVTYGAHYSEVTTTNIF